MKTIIIKKDLKWLPNGSSLTLYDTDQLPEGFIDTISSVFAFVILNNRILVVQKKDHKDVLIPNFLTEISETLSHSVKKGLLDKIGIKGLIPELMALYKIEDALSNPIKNDFHAFFIIKVDTIGHFSDNTEFKERNFLTKDQFLDLGWAKRNKELVDLFLTKI